MVAAFAHHEEADRLEGNTEHPGVDVSALDVGLPAACPALTVSAVLVGSDAGEGWLARRHARGMNCCLSTVTIGRLTLVICHGDITLGPSIFHVSLRLPNQRDNR